MSQVVPLEAIMLSVEAVKKWHHKCSEAVREMKRLIEKGKLDEPSNKR